MVNYYLKGYEKKNTSYEESKYVVEELQSSSSKISDIERNLYTDNCACPECPECSCSNVLSIPGAAAATSLLVSFGAGHVSLAGA